MTFPAAVQSESGVIDDAFPTWHAGRLPLWKESAEAVRFGRMSPGFVCNALSDSQHQVIATGSAIIRPISSSGKLRALYESVAMAPPFFNAVVSERIYEASEKVNEFTNRWFVDPQAVVNIGKISNDFYRALDDVVQLVSTVVIDAGDWATQIGSTIGAVYANWASDGPSLVDSSSAQTALLGEALVDKVRAYMEGTVPGQDFAPLLKAVGTRSLELAADLAVLTGVRPSISSAEPDSATVQVRLDDERKLFVEVRADTIEAVIYHKGRGIEAVDASDEGALFRCLATAS